MRTRWTRRDVDERTDRELTRLFSDAAQRLEPDARALRLAQARVAAKLARAEAERGGLRRRLALGTLGGGALWATALGSAAAHKAAAIAVVGGLLLGGVVAEQSGVAPAVRETIGIERAFDALTSQDDGATGAQDSGAATEIASPSATLPAAATSVHTEAAPDGLPGQLHTTLTPGGDFNLRAVLQGYGAASVDLYVAGDEGGETVTLSLAPEAVLNVPGKPGEETGTGQLADYLGRLVVVHGHCESGVEDLGSGATGCSASRLQILGGPADSGPPAGSSSSERGASEERGQGEANGGGNGNSHADGNASGGGGSNAAPNSNAGGNANGGGSSNAAPNSSAGGNNPDPGTGAGAQGEQQSGGAPNEPGPPEHSSAGGQGNNHSPE